MAKRRKSSKTSVPKRFSAEITRWRDGDTTKPDPLFILIINNPALESRFGNTQFIPDMNTNAERRFFNKAAKYINENLFGELPNQKEKLLANSNHSLKIKLWSMYIDALKPSDSTSLVQEFGVHASDLFLKPRRGAVVNMLANIGMHPDVVFIVSKVSDVSTASALGMTDDDSQGGIPTTLDGRKITHRFYHKIPGMVAIHSDDNSDMTAAHEFGHAFSSYSNGFITDLYRDADLYCHGTTVLNRKMGRPIPNDFGEYHGLTYLSDKVRNSLGYGSMTSYHSELADPGRVALMDDYWKAIPIRSSLHDKLTKAYILDRIAAKVSR